MNTAPPIGNTPLVCVDGIYAKLECCNPTGSSKDRMASYILAKSEDRGVLRKGMTVVEATSGCTGIAFAYHARRRGYPVIVVMPDNTTEERRTIIRAMGAELILSSGAEGYTAATAIRDDMVRKDPGTYFSPDQFANPLNVDCHRLITAREILRQFPQGRPIGALVAAVGTGGTLIGIGQALREINPKVRVIAVEPDEAAVMSGCCYCPHKIGGIGGGIIPPLVTDGHGGLHPTIDEVIRINSEDAIAAAKELAQKHGLCVGVSAGANFVAARMVRKRYTNVVTIFADGAAKYRSLGLTGSAKCPYRKAASADPLLELVTCA